MLKRIPFRVYVLYIAALMIVLTITDILLSFKFLSNISTRLSSNPPISHPSVSTELGKLLVCLVLLVALFIGFILLAAIVIRHVKRQIELERSLSRESESKHQEEMDKQCRAISNLTNLYRDAINYEKLKTQFFTDISHELKTPLTVILGAVQLIDQKNLELPAEQKKTLKHFFIIKQNCFRLLRLINNLLDITKIDSGFININTVNCNIVYLIEEITQSVIPYAEQKGLLVEFDTDTEEIITSVDVDKIERIILNLLSNAIKFTGNGGKITVNVTSTNAKVMISVKDTGAGIPPHMIDKIFERFRQVNSVQSRPFEGSGIGLSLVKSFVELHDGNISVKSELNKGSEFIIELPRKVCEENKENSYILHNDQSKIIETIRIEFSDIYSIAS